MLTNLPLNVSNRNRRRAEMNERLYEICDRIDAIQDKIEELNTKKITLSNEQMTLENIKAFMYSFNDIYDACNAEERQQLVRYIFKRIDIYEDWSDERMIKSIELNFRIYNDQAEVAEIIKDAPRNEVLDMLNKANYNSYVDLSFSLEENDLLIPIYEKVNNYFMEQLRMLPTRRGPYNTMAKYSDIISWVKENYGIKIYGAQIASIRKKYGVAAHNANYLHLSSTPKPETAEAIRRSLIHFGVLTEDMEPIEENDIELDSITNTTRVRAKKYARKHATYPEIKAYILDAYGLKVSTANIAQIKREYGVEMQADRTKEESRHPNIPQAKRDALVETLYHFRIIEK